MMSALTRNRQTSVHDEAEIRRLIAAWSKAVESKNLDGITVDYAPDALLYDAIPPYKTVGAGAIRTAWEQCLPCFPDEFRSEHRDLVVHVDGDLAVIHGLHHFVPSQADHPCGQTWMRVTVCYRRTKGKWKVIHEHVSVPFNPLNNQAWQIRDPNVLDAPDYGDASGCSPVQEGLT